MKNEGFSTGVMQRLTGLSFARIDYYARNGIVTPDYATADGPGSRRAWSKRNLVELRVIARLLHAGLSFLRVHRGLLAVHLLFENVNRPLLTLRFATDGVGLYARRKEGEPLVDLLNIDQPVLGSAIAQTTREIDSSIEEIHPSAIQTIRINGKHFYLAITKNESSWSALSLDYKHIEVEKPARNQLIEVMRARIIEELKRG